MNLTTARSLRRAREIGIRKVLGAGTAQLFILLARDFLLLVLLAFVIATPVAAWAMQRWLEGYAYHAPLSGAIFVGAPSDRTADWGRADWSRKFEQNALI